QAAAANIDFYVLEEPGGIESLQRIVDFDGIRTISGPDLDVAPDRIHIDAPISLHNDGADGLGASNAGRRNRNSSKSGSPGECQGRDDRESPQDADQKIHAIRYLLSPLRLALRAKPSASARWNARILLNFKTCTGFSDTCKRPTALLLLLSTMPFSMKNGINRPFKTVPTGPLLPAHHLRGRQPDSDQFRNDCRSVRAKMGPNPGHPR